MKKVSKKFRLRCSKDLVIKKIKIKKRNIKNEKILSAQEVKIMELIARGLENVQIANILYLSKHTVKAHVAVIFRKLNAINRAHAVFIASKKHLI